MSQQGKKRNGKRLYALPLGGRQRMIEEAAYYRAERRGFAPGDELHDWLEAENEINEMISNNIR
jgi:hypothetical protein